MSTPAPSGDRDLIFGLLALRMDFVTREQFLEAMHAWMFAKQTPLGQILRARGILSERRAGLLEAMVEDHLAQNGGDAQRSLSALRVEPSVRQDLDGLDDAEVRSSIAWLTPPLPGAAETPTRHGAADVSLTNPDTVAPTLSIPTAMRFRRMHNHAKGGLGEVFVALDEELHREVALKEIQVRFADESEARGRFLREAEITGKLEHPGVVPVYGLGSYADGRPFYAMRFIRGESMKEAIGRFHKADEDPRRDLGERSLALRELLGRFVAVCNAVAYAHVRGVIHRDLKPANVMLGEYGETLVVDWGLARVLEQTESEQTCAERPVRLSARSDTAATEMGQVVGTPAYMPPEQASGRLDQVGITSDVFALGATLYCLLTGQAPYNGIDAVIQAAIAEHVPARRRKPSVPAALDAVCGKAMVVNPGDRYATARELAEDVQRWLADEPVRAYREPLADRVRRWSRRNRSVVSAGVVLLVAGVVGLSLGLWAVEREREKTNAVLGRALTAEHEAKAAAHVAAQEQEKAQKAEASTLADYRASTDDAIEHLIGSKPVLGAQEKTYLERTLKRWQVFAARTGDDERSRAIHAEGQFRVAKLRTKLGQNKKAVAGYREALTIFQKLADEFPAVSSYSHYLASTHSNLGALLEAQNQGERAAEQYREALTIFQKLADEFPAVPESRKDLALTHNNLGLLLKNQNQGGKAAEHFHKALTIGQKLVDEFPAVPAYRFDLASTHNNLGLLLEAQNQGGKAAEQYHKALTIGQKLVDEFPAVPAYRFDLAGSHNNLGALLADQNQVEKAAEQYRDALSIGQKLVDEFPAVPEYRKDLAGSHNNLGALLMNQDEGEKAAEQYRKALAIQQRLADEFPAVTAYQVDLGGGCSNYGHLLLGRGKPADCLPWFDKAVRTLTRVHQQNPRVVTPRLFLRNSHLGRARAYDQLEKHAEAVKDWNLAIALSLRQEQASLRAQRASSRVRAGQVAEAVAEVAELTKAGNWSASEWYGFACVYAVASGKDADTKQEYADRAMELLHKAVKAGYKDAAHMAKDKDLNVLRGRDDFEKLLEALPKPKATEKGALKVPEKK